MKRELAEAWVRWKNANLHLMDPATFQAPEAQRNDIENLLWTAFVAGYTAQMIRRDCSETSWQNDALILTQHAIKQRDLLSALRAKGHVLQSNDLSNWIKRAIRIGKVTKPKHGYLLRAEDVTGDS